MPFDPPAIHEFRHRLLGWYRASKRDLPWRRTRDPYAIWVSEIMLQQTRVTAAIPYYERFLQRFPDFQRLAAASESDLLAHWAGLGYYHRARNLQKAAQAIARSGRFPSTHAGIRELPGVGDYTAAAVASIGFDLPHAVVDGNVLRVLSRVANDPTDIAAPSGKKRFAAIAEALLDRHHPGEYNQALMELGATVCLPKNPQCLVCPVSSICLARAAGIQDQLPVKNKPRRSVVEHRHVFWIERDSAILLWQRPAASSLMPGFWELPEPAQLPCLLPPEISSAADTMMILGSFRHTITFHHYRFDVVNAQPPQDIGPCHWVPLADLPHMPLSTIFRKARKVVSVEAAAGAKPARRTAAGA